MQSNHLNFTISNHLNPNLFILMNLTTPRALLDHTTIYYNLLPINLPPPFAILTQYTMTFLYFILIMSFVLVILIMSYCVVFILPLLILIKICMAKYTGGTLSL